MEYLRSSPALFLDPMGLDSLDGAFPLRPVNPGNEAGLAPSVGQNGEYHNDGPQVHTPQLPSEGGTSGPTLIDLLAAAWNSPNTFIGILAGVLGGGEMELSGSQIRFLRTKCMPSAMTLGNVVLYGGLGPNDPRPEGGAGTVSDHEQQHIIQGAVLGPFYIPAHLIGKIIGIVKDGGTHGPNDPLERGPQSPVPKPW
jgi:hypothetical protein